MRPYFVMVIASFFLLSACCENADVQYAQKQADVVSQYQKKGYFEYHSRLNDIMKSELNNLGGQMMPEETREHLLDLAEELEKSREPGGCYVLPWQPTVARNAKDNAITLEWDPQQGVVIRMFTNSVQVAKRLPTQSY